MGDRIAVVHEAHCVGFRIQAWMLDQVGFRVFAAGRSFGAVLPGFHNCGQRLPEVRGEIELGALPEGALFVDTHPESVRRLRETGWGGPALVIWLMPVGPEWVESNFRPGHRLASLAWSASVGRRIKAMDACPNDYFFPPYHGPLDQSPRPAFGSFLMTVVQNAAGWSNVPLLEELRDDPDARLELYGGGPPGWSRWIPQPDLFRRMRESLAMYHLKPFDTPGFAVMEAVLQGVPVIFPPDWIRLTDWGLFEDGKSCLVVESKKEAVLGAARHLRDTGANLGIGREGRRRLLEAADWAANRPRLERLLAAIGA